MEFYTLLTVAFGLLAISSYALWFKNTNQYNGLIASIFMLLNLLFLKDSFSDNPELDKLIALPIALIFIAYLLGKFIKNKWIVLLAPLLLLSFLLLNNASFEFYDAVLLFNKSNALLVPFVGAIIPIFVSVLSTKLYRPLYVKYEKLYNIFTYLSGALAVLFAFTFAGVFGLFLLAIGYQVSKNISSKNQNFGFTYTLMIPVMLHAIIQKNELTPNTILHGSVLTGLVAGIAIVSWFGLFKNVNHRSTLQKVAIWILPSILTLTLIHVEMLKENLGGVSALIGLSIAFALGYALISSFVESILTSLLALLTLIGISNMDTLHPSMESAVKNEKFADLIEDKPNKEKSFSIADFTGIDFNTIQGTWKIAESTSKIDFELGPSDARTKGEITKLSGKLVAAGENSRIDVDIQVKSVSTFNQFRDESLMEDIYFSEAKFPTMRYQAKGVKITGDSFQSTGLFTLRGITKEVPVDFKVVKQGSEGGKSFILLVGQAKLNRTDYGMSSDPKIGDLVDFHFQIELNQ